MLSCVFSVNDIIIYCLLPILHLPLSQVTVHAGCPVQSHFIIFLIFILCDTRVLLCAVFLCNDKKNLCAINQALCRCTKAILQLYGNVMITLAHLINKPKSNICSCNAIVFVDLYRLVPSSN